jgi:DNA-binding YbaB/EbfC family protein
MKQLGEMMKQAQQMQQKMGELQDAMAAIEVEGVAGAGMVRVTQNGKGEVKAVKIDPSVVDPGDVEMLEDLLAAAMNDAKSKSQMASEAETQKLMGGLKLPPGFKLPF